MPPTAWAYLELVQPPPVVRDVAHDLDGAHARGTAIADHACQRLEQGALAGSRGPQQQREPALQVDTHTGCCEKDCGMLLCEQQCEPVLQLNE